MTGGTLMVSRAVINHGYYKKRLEELGFPNVRVTDEEKDGLNSLIDDFKPGLILIGAKFYECCTPFLMKGLKQRFPKIKMAALCVGHYPADLGMYFILNGVNSYVTSFDGIGQWYEGLNEISKGRDWVSPSAVERIDKRQAYPFPAGNITDRHKQIILLMCNGFRDFEIGELLYITRRTVYTHKTEIFTALNVRNSNELIRAALKLGIVAQDCMYFYPKGFVLNPLPDEKVLKRRTA